MLILTSSGTSFSGAVTLVASVVGQKIRVFGVHVAFRNTSAADAVLTVRDGASGATNSRFSAELPTTAALTEFHDIGMAPWTTPAGGHIEFQVV